MHKNELNKIEIYNFKSIKALTLTLDDLNIFIGPNGVGKSNFIGVFKFLNKVIIVIVPDGINFGQVSQNGLGGSALMAVNTSIDTFKIFTISVERIEGNSQVVALNQSVSLEPGGVQPLLFAFFPGGAGTDTTRAIITIHTNDPYNSEKTFAVEGVVIPTAVVEAEPANMIKTYELLQNYPNPYNPVTTITYFLPKMQHVTLKVYDLLGREIKTLVDGYKMAGQHEEIFDAENLSSGMYIYKLETEEFYMMKKMVFVR